MKNIYLWKFDHFCITDSEIFPIAYDTEPPKKIQVVRPHHDGFTTSFFDLIVGVIMEGLPVYKQVDIKTN